MNLKNGRKKKLKKRSRRRKTAVRLISYRRFCINRDYSIWSKYSTNPNVSPIGKRFGFECFGARDGT